MMRWQQLTELTNGTQFSVERVRLRPSGIAVEGDFEPPLLAQLTVEDQLFIVAFVRSHGSIKEMERIFGVSYPTVKARLKRLSEELRPAMDVELVAGDGPAQGERRGVLDRLQQGEISVQQALEELRR